MAIAMVDSPMLSRFERLLRWLPRAAARALFAATFPLGFYSLTMEVTLRAYAIDDIIRKFVASGGRQIVILGAGLDTRALRLAPELPDGTIVVEVDHPASAAAKQVALKKVGAELPPHLRFHASDLSSASELDALPQRLKCLGLDPKRPTLTIMEGLIMYLPPAAVDRLLDAVAAFSAAPGSEIAMNYITEADRKRFFTPPRLLRPSTWSLLRLWFMLSVADDEPLVHPGLSEAALPGYLASHGWELQLSQPAAWWAVKRFEAHGAAPPKAIAQRAERPSAVSQIALANRRSE